MELTKTLLDRFKETKDILLSTFTQLNNKEIGSMDGTEKSMYAIIPVYLFMYSCVVNERLPEGHKTEAEVRLMQQQIKSISAVSAAEYKKRQDVTDGDVYFNGFTVLLETYLLMYYAYIERFMPNEPRKTFG